MSRTSFTQMRMRGTPFRGADLRGVRFTQCDLSHADFTGAQLDGATFTQCDLSKATLPANALAVATFTQCRMDIYAIANEPPASLITTPHRPTPPPGWPMTSAPWPGTTSPWPMMVTAPYGPMVRRVEDADRIITRERLCFPRPVKGSSIAHDVVLADDASIDDLEKATPEELDRWIARRRAQEPRPAPRRWPLGVKPHQAGAVIAGLVAYVIARLLGIL